MEKKQSNINVRFWERIAWIAAIFSFIICVLLIANYLQMNRIDPINTEIINKLVQRLSENPNDEALKDQIREMDLLARKAYFTSQWQVRTGGYLLLAGIVVFVLAMQFVNAADDKKPEVPDQKTASHLLFQRTARRGVAIGGAVLVAITLMVAYLTHYRLEESFTKQAENIVEQKETEHSQPVEQVKEPTETATEEIEETADPEMVAATENNEAQITEEPEKAEEQVVKKETQEEKITDVQLGYPTEEMKKNFPSFRGPGGNGIDYHKNIPTDWDGASGKNIRWKAEISLPGYNSPVIWGDRLFLSGADAKKKMVYCFNRHTGDILWTVTVDNIPGSPATAPEVTDDTGHSAPSVTTDGKRVYAIFSTGDIIAVDMQGKRVWAKNLGVPKNHYGHSSSLYMYKDNVIVQYDHSSASKVMALSGSTGEIVWETNRRGKISWASPVIVENKGRVEIFLVTDPFVASYDAETGKELWRIDCLYGEIGPSVAYADGIVYATNEYASLVAIKANQTPEIIWESYDYLSDVPSPVATKDYLFLATSYGVVVCYDAKNGSIIWEHEFNFGFYASPILSDGKLYIMDRDGNMHIIKADKEFQLIGSPALGEPSVSTPAFADGRIYIRAGNNLYCIGSN